MSRVCKISASGCLVDKAGMVSLLKCKLRMTAKNSNKQLPSVRNAAAILWERRFTSPKSRSMIVLVRMVFQCYARIGIQGQAGLQITPQARNSGRIHFLILLDKSGHGLISRWPIFLREQGAQLWFELLLLLGGHVAQHVVHFVNDTALTSGVGELIRDGIKHGLVAIADPEINRFDASLFEIVQQVFPSLLIFSIPHAERQHVSLSRFSTTHHGQDGHLAPLAVINDGEVGSIRKRVH